MPGMAKCSLQSEADMLCVAKYTFAGKFTVLLLTTDVYEIKQKGNYNENRNNV